MKLYLVQHGEAAGSDVDPQRPLTEKGLSDVHRVAAALGNSGIRIERVLHSGKLRARQTAEILAAQAAPGVEPATTRGAIGPNDDPAGFDPRDESGTADMLVVGHLPFLSRLVSRLVAGDSEQALVAFQPGSVVCLESVEDGAWRIDWMLRPELLR